jgi:hypothetical protein
VGCCTALRHYPRLFGYCRPLAKSGQLDQKPVRICWQIWRSRRAAIALGSESFRGSFYRMILVFLALVTWWLCKRCDLYVIGPRSSGRRAGRVLAFLTGVILWRSPTGAVRSYPDGAHRRRLWLSLAAGVRGGAKRRSGIGGGTRKRRWGVGGQGAQRRSKGPKERSDEGRGRPGDRAQREAQGRPNSCRLSRPQIKIPTERSEGGNAELCHEPLCPFPFLLESGALAEDRGQIC